MNPSMVSSSVSMQGLQQKLDVIAHNIANVNTTGFKRKEATFHDILTSAIRQPEGFRQEGRLTPPGFTQGWGAKIGQIQLDMTRGSLQMTDNPLDVAIEGDALFEVERDTIDENGNRIVEPAWTKQGSFELSLQPGDQDNVYLTTKDGQLVRNIEDQPIRIPNNHRIQIDDQGNITAYSEIRREAPPIAIGRLKIVHIIRPQLLKQIGDKLFVLQDGVENVNGGVLQPLNANINQANRPKVAVRQGFVEQSNVNLVSEMAELMLVQRAFQLNSRALVSSDAMMNLTNSLRG